MWKHSITAGTVAVLLTLGGDLSAQRQGTFLIPSPDEGTTRVAQRGANFLEIGIGARGRAMGGAYTALADGATAAYWNPAALAGIERFTVSFSYSALYDDLNIDHNFGAVAVPLAGGVVGVSYIRLDSGDIPRTDESNPGGGLVTTGDFFQWASTAVGLHYGRRLTDRLQVGFTGRVITEGINQAQIQWFGLDFGTVFNTGLYGLTLGAALVNIGPSSRFEGGLVEARVNTDRAFPIALPIRFNTSDYQLPTAFRFSVASTLVGGADALLSPNADHSWRLAWDLNDAVDTDIQLSIGTEYSFRELIFLRVGKQFVNEANDDFRSFSDFLSFGGGIRLPVFGGSLSFDYAYTNAGDLQNVQVFSFELGH